jgi:hypothetical protein
MGARGRSAEQDEPVTEPVGASLEAPSDVVVSESKRTITDATRSLARYFALWLGDAWEVRYDAEEYTFKTPFARVEALSNTIVTEGVNYHAVIQPFSVYAYPDYPEGTEGSAEESRLIAMEVAQDLLDALVIGGVDGSRPLRVPFYNYAGVPLDGGGSNARTPYDYLRIVRGSANVDRVPDPTDPRWITVVLGFRAMWFRRGEQILGKTVQSVQSEFDTASFSG